MLPTLFGSRQSGSDYLSILQQKDTVLSTESEGTEMPKAGGHEEGLGLVREMLVGEEGKGGITFE